MSSSAAEVTVDEAIERIGFGRFQLALVAICGMIQAVDAIEMLLLSVLGPSVSCEWNLTSQEVAFVTTAVFLGMLIGCPLWGMLADRKGRWAVLLLTTSFITYFGLLSAASPNYLWLVLLRGLVGFGIGGVMASAASLFGEFMPSSARAPGMMAMLCCWSIGAVMMAGLAYVVLPSIGWRWLVVFAAVPLLLSLFSFAWTPKSPRFLLVVGKEEEARMVINRIARLNGKEEITGKLHADRSARGTFAQLFHKNYWLCTLMQWYIWLASGFVYYGIVLVSAELPTTSHRCLQDPSRSSELRLPFHDDSCCTALTDASYLGILISTLGEFAALPFNACMLQLVGRKATMAVASFIGAITFFCLNFCAPVIVTNFLLLLTRFACQSVFTAAYVYTNELYPTSVRVLGMGCCSAMARIGAMLTPFVAQVLLPGHSVLAATAVYTAVMALMGVCAALLPVETKGRPLPQTVDDQPGMAAGDGKSYDTFKAKGKAL